MFRPRPYDPDREFCPRSKAQRAAQERNFRIFRLRGLYAQVGLLTGWRRKVAQWLVDIELRRIGAESESERHLKRLLKWGMN